MPEESKKIVMQFSNELKSFNQIFADMGKKPVNMNEANLVKLRKAKEKIASSTIKYLNALAVDPKIIKAIEGMIEDGKVQNIQSKKELEDIANAIRQEFIDNPEKKYADRNKPIAEVMKPWTELWGDYSYGRPPVRGVMTILAVGEMFKIINKNPRALRLDESKNIADLQKLEILWHGASIIADESNIHYFRRNLINGVRTILESLIDGPILVVTVITTLAVAAVFQIALTSVLVAGNLARLDPTAAISRTVDILDIATSAIVVALAAIPMSFYYAGIVSTQNSKNTQEVKLLDQALKKVISVFDAVEAVEKEIDNKKPTNSGSSPG